MAGVASPCCFYRKRDDVSCVVHGDDLTFEGPPDSLLEVSAALKKVWLVKVRAMRGPKPQDDKEIFILNRVVRWCDDHLLYEADPRHVGKLLRNRAWRTANPCQLLVSRVRCLASSLRTGFTRATHSPHLLNPKVESRGNAGVSFGGSTVQLLGNRPLRGSLHDEGAMQSNVQSFG